LSQYHGALDKALDEQDDAAVRELRSGWKRKGRSWAKRDLDSVELDPPPKRHRSAAYAFLCAVQNMFSVSFNWPLTKFRALPSVYDDLNSDPYSWPSLRLSLDRGSDGRAALFFLMYSLVFKLNIEAIWDASHDVARDVEGAVADIGCFHLITLILVVWNLPFGPWDSGTRHGQLLESMAEYFRGISHRTCPLFNLTWETMAAEMGIHEHSSDRDSFMADMWKHFKECRAFRCRGSKTTMTRFLGFSIKLRRRCPYGPPSILRIHIMA